MKKLIKLCLFVIFAFVLIGCTDNKPTKIEIDTNTVSSYYDIDNIDFSKIKLKVIRNDKEEIISLSKDMITNLDVLTKSGQYHLNVKYEDYECDFVITVVKFYTITFKFKDEVIKTEKVKEGESATAPIVEKEGYEITGWDKDYNNITSDLEINAEYVKVYTVTFKFKDEVIKTEKVREGESATAPIVEKKEYKVTGWDKDYSNITNDLEVNALFISLKDKILNRIGGFIRRDSYQYYLYDVNKTEFYEYDDYYIVKAIYLDAYIVTFMLEGEIIKTEKVAKRRSATAPTVEKEGYEVTGWDKDYSNITNDLVVNAIFVRVYIVTFILDGEIIKTEKVREGESATAPLNENYMYTISGWDKDYSNIASNLEVNATFLTFMERALGSFGGCEIVQGTFEYTEYDTYFIIKGEAIRETMSSYFQGKKYIKIDEGLYYILDDSTILYRFILKKEMELNDCDRYSYISMDLSQGYEHKFLSKDFLLQISDKYVTENKEQFENVKSVTDEEIDTITKAYFEFDESGKNQAICPGTKKEIGVDSFHYICHLGESVVFTFDVQKGFGYTRYEYVGDIKFIHRSPIWAFFVYNNGKVYNISIAYEEGIISLEDVHSIPCFVASTKKYEE